MKSQLLIILVLLINISCQNSQSLFQENSQDWIEKGDANWSFSNGELTGTVANAKVGFVMTKQSFKNFLLELEFNPDSIINSGVFIRCKNYEIDIIDCHEVNIWDLHPNQDFRTGAVVKRAKPRSIVETIGKWNTYKIKIEQDHLEVWINGVLTVDMIDNTLIKGYVGLQASGSGEIGFRNIKITDLDLD